MEEKRPNDRFRVNTAILLIYGPIIGLTLQTRYVIKRSGISVKSYGVARWIRRIWAFKKVYNFIESSLKLRNLIVNEFDPQ